MSKVAVPIVYLVGYGAFVVVATLLVGLLPPLVNRPACDPSGLPSSRLNGPVVVKQADPVAMPLAVEREKRQAVVETPKNVYETKLKNFRDNVEPKLKNDAFYKKYFKNKGISDICPELTNPQPGVQYPWNNTRLPTNIRPYQYTLTLYFYERDVFQGDNVIRFDVDQPTNYIILHTAENDLADIQSLKNNLGQDVAIDCIGEYVNGKLDYLIIKTVEPLSPNFQPYSLDIAFVDFNLRTESGIFKLTYDRNRELVASKFQPIDARRAYPIFDEPSMKAIYNVIIYHRDDFIALSNEQIQSFNLTSDLPGVSRTVFDRTEPMPSYFMAYLAFSRDDFDKVTTEVNTPNGPIFVNLWARRQLIQNGFATSPLLLIERILEGILDIMRNVNPICIPSKIDVFAIPDYPVDGIAHQGLPIIKEEKILFKNSTASERDKQNVAFLIAKMFAQIWFGNCVTHPWWDQLWLTEGFSDYIKYRAIEEYFGEWNIVTEFLTEELIPTIILDGYPSSHPIIKPINNAYDIEEYYDEIESSKAAAILRWVENEKNVATFYQAFSTYLSQNTWSTGKINDFYAALGTIGNKLWPAKDFFDRWTLQSNFPLLEVQLIAGTPQQVRFTQSRSINRNDSIFIGPPLYPSPYDYTWYIPTTCEVGVGRNTADAARIVEFYIDQRTETFNLPNAPNGQRWQWINCDKDFVGFYEAQYSEVDWIQLLLAIKNKNLNFEPEDRANIIHNIFLNAYAERGDYFKVSTLLELLETERDYLPWRTVFIHFQNIIPVLEYRQAFYAVSTFMSFVLRFVERDIDIWTPTDTHIGNLLRETIGQMACLFQDPICIQKTADLWEEVRKGLQSGNFEASTVAPYVREIVYNYHIQNTYDVDDWNQIYFDAVNILDEAEQRKLLEALTFARLPWLLARLEKDDRISVKVNYFELNALISNSPVGREITWDNFRLEYNNLVDEYTNDDTRIGQLLIDISDTFENEFLFYELLEWVFFVVDGATANARTKALEIASTNIVWLYDKEQEIADAFNLVNGGGGRKGSSPNRNPLLEFSQQNMKMKFLQTARQALREKLAATNLEVFAELKKTLL